MNFATVLTCAVFSALTTYVASQGTCGGACTSSAACAISSGDPGCRCINLVCRNEAPCAGGCVLDAQCALWAGGDTNCVCQLFTCALQGQANNAPGYNPFLELAMTKMSKEKREQLQQSEKE